MADTNIANNSILIEQDRACIWHPFTQMQTARPFISIVKGEGIYLYGSDGRKYLDGISSWWSNLHGHAHPYIAAKIKEQLDILEHVSFCDFTHPPAIELAFRLLALLPGKMSKVFYSDNGSTAVETALKMALQYWYNQDARTQRTKIVCFKGSYHGDTFGAMSASGRNDFNKPFWKHLFEIESIDLPIEGKEQESMQQLKRILDQEKTACFIFEPMVLGAGGMIMYPAASLDMILKICKDHHVLTIADEVMTGFGRTGPLFACAHLNEMPDIICLSKGLTGGFLPLSATACTEKIYEAFLGDHLHQALLHGHTYTGNPLACASALASLDLLLEDECGKKRDMIAACHRSFCEKWKYHPKLKRCESLGTILALEYQSDGTAAYFQPIRDRLYRFFLDRGILLRPLGNVLYVMPPYCIKKDELQWIYDHIIITL